MEVVSYVMSLNVNQVHKAKLINVSHMEAENDVM
jgi:hypothetical protein